MIVKGKIFMIVAVVLQFSISLITNAQVDTLILKNNNEIFGEIKSMNKGVLQVETDYSDSDFTVKWNEIKYISTVTTFLISINDGEKYNGTLKSVDINKIAITHSADVVVYDSESIVSLNSVNENFWSRLNASIDIGYSSTKANNFNQFTSNSTMGYLAERWSSDIYYNSLFTSQDGVDDTKRIDYGAAYKQYIKRGWYVPVDITFLTNNEQLIDLRAVGKLGFGKFFIQKNSAYWGAAVGVSYVSEIFIAATDTTLAADSRQSYESFIGTELNLFDIGDFSLFTKLVVYPSITEKGRIRSDFDINTKYEFPMDFYAKLSLSLNYDNQPVEGAPEMDYVTSIGVGWAW